MMIKKAADPSNVCVIPSPELKDRLGTSAFAIVAQGGTEPAFDNAYWDNHAEGVYLDVIDSTPLFMSTTKYDSGSGWPSFWAPIADDRVEFIEDISYGMNRIEVRSTSSGAHLGHLFKDGPEPAGKRFCMNSASLRFISRDRLKESGLEEFDKLFP